MAAMEHLSLRSLFAVSPSAPNPEPEFDTIPEHEDASLLPGAFGDEFGDLGGGRRYQPKWRPSERRLAVDAVDELLDAAEEAMKGCSTSLDWEEAIEQLENVRLKVPEMRGMDGSEQRIARLNADLRRSEQERKKMEQVEASSADAKAALAKRKEQANKLMKDFEKANQKGRFKGKMAKYAKKTAPTFVDLEPEDVDKMNAPLFSADDVIQVADLSNPEAWQDDVEEDKGSDDESDLDSEEEAERKKAEAEKPDYGDGDTGSTARPKIPETRWFIAEVVDYTGEGNGGDSYRLMYRWRNVSTGALFDNTCTLLYVFISETCSNASPAACGWMGRREPTERCIWIPIRR